MNGTNNITPSEIVNVIGEGISKEQAETFAQQMVGDYGWLLLVAIVTIMATVSYTHLTLPTIYTV